MTTLEELEKFAEKHKGVKITQKHFTKDLMASTFFIPNGEVRPLDNSYEDPKIYKIMGKFYKHEDDTGVDSEVVFDLELMDLDLFVLFE